MKRKFEKILENVSENNNSMLENAPDLGEEPDMNYVSRRGIHLALEYLTVGLSFYLFESV